MATTVTANVKCDDDLFCGVNAVKDRGHMTDLEKKHLPMITAPRSIQKEVRFEVQVEVGKLLQHPNDPAHHIEFIDLYADHTFLARMDLTAQLTWPIMKTCVCLRHTHGKLRAFAHCNLHGTWEGDVPIEVNS